MKTRIYLRLLAAGMLLLSFSSLKGQTDEFIWLTSVPGWGNASSNLYGKVNADPQSYRVAGLIFIEEAGGWWTKPSFANPTVQILADSSFVTGPQQLPGAGFQRGRGPAGGISRSSLCHCRKTPWRQAPGMGWHQLDREKIRR